jgi:glycosyltransferase involved in cell wall biosynthesis
MSLAVIIPTLFERDEYLAECLASIIGETETFICVVAPAGCREKVEALPVPINLFVEDPGSGLAAAINLAAANLPSHIKHFSWLGDDDRWRGAGIAKALQLLESSEGIVAVYGNINFIDEKGKDFFRFRSSRLAPLFSKFGPNKVPQPGSLIRLQAFKRLGGLDQNLKFAFDQDLFARLPSTGKLFYVDETLADFRWHPLSLSAGQSAKSIREASVVRISHYSKALKVLMLPVERVHVWLAIRIEGKLARKLRE